MRGGFSEMFGCWEGVAGAYTIDVRWSVADAGRDVAGAFYCRHLGALINFPQCVRGLIIG